MSAKDELRAFIEALTPEEIQRIFLRLPQINAELAAEGLPVIAFAAEQIEETTAEAPCILADDLRSA